MRTFDRVLVNWKRKISSITHILFYFQYDNLQQYKLPFPEAIFDLDFFRHNPEAFVSLAKEIWMGNKYAPTITHSFVALLAKKGQLLRNYTQNIDGLEYLANLPTDKLVEWYGVISTH